MNKKRRRRRRRRRNNRLIILVAAVVIVIVAVIIIVVSCSGKKSGQGSMRETTAESSTALETASTEAASKAAATHTSADYARDGVDELFAIPIFMYHRIYDMKNSETDYTGGNVDVDGYNRTSEAFEADLEQYYQWGYRCVRLTDMVDGRIDTEYGYSPMVITFDDGMDECGITGFDETGYPVFKNHSALAIMEEMKKKHPDFNVTATFFLNQGLFGNGDELDRQLIKWLVDNGYDIGNHTMNHPMLSPISADEIEREVGGIYKILNDIIPGKYVNIVALPYGDPTDTTSDSKYEKIFSGTCDGFAYKTKATLLCSWTYSESPFNKNFQYNYIKRIRAYDNDGQNFDIQYNMGMLNDGRRYISDGNPDTIVIHKEDRQYLGDTHGREVVEY